MTRPTKDFGESRRIYALIEYGPPAILINWDQIAANYHFNIKQKLKAAGYMADEENVGKITRYSKTLRKVNV